MDLWNPSYKKNAICIDYRYGCEGKLEYVAYEYRFCGIKCYRTKDSVRIKRYHLYGGDEMSLNIGKYIVESPDIVEKISQLYKGLDDVSKEILTLLIKRLKKQYIHMVKEKYANTHYHVYDLTQKEAQMLYKIQHEFYPNIIQLHNDIYCYNGYFLPMDAMSSHTFYEKYNIQSFTTLDRIRKKNIIDVGAYIGDTALIFQDFTIRNVYAFEATKTNYALMLKTLELNKTSRVIPINKGLGATYQKLQIGVNGGASSLLTQYQHNDKFEWAEIITLDSYIKEHNIEVGFIKVDIEGFEMEFLKGATQTIMEQKPAMLISIYHQGSDFFEIKPMIESWNLGYSFRIVRPANFNISAETALLCEVLDS